MIQSFFRFLFLSLALLSGAAVARAQWFDFQPGYYTKVDIGTARVEGGGKLSTPLSAYGFVDFYGQTKAKFDLNTYYGEARLMHSLSWVDPNWQAWNLTAEVNGGTDYDGILRLGVVWNTSLGAGNAIALKLYPVASRDRDAHASIYCSQMFTPRFSGFLVFDYGFGTWIFGENQIYVELEARYRLTKKLSAFVQGRQFAGITGFRLDPTPVVGLKWSF